MTQGWARAAEAPWSETEFRLDGDALVVHRIGLGLPPRRISLARIRSVDEVGPPDQRPAGWVEAELTTTNGAVVEVWWPESFCRTVVDALLDDGEGDPPDRSRPDRSQPDRSQPDRVEPEPGSPGSGNAPPHLFAPADEPMDGATAGPTGRRARRSPPRSRARPRARRRAGLAAVALVALVGADLFALHLRVDRVRVDLPRAEDGIRTWLLVGSDSRAAAAGLPRPDTFGTTEDVPGERADVVLLVQEGAGGREPRVVSVPRDLLVFRRGHGVDRLALSLLDGPTGLTTSICRSLGVPVDHVVTVRFDGLRDLVDAVGGVDVEAAHPARDLHTGLDLPEGTGHLDGAGAVAWLRSRHLEQRVDGRWVGDASSDTGRQQRQRDLLDRLSAAMVHQARHPVRAQRLAWTASGALTTDGGTGPVDLVRLATTLRATEVEESLPHTLVDGGIPVATLDPAAQQILDDMRNARPDGPPCPRARIAG